MEPNECPACSLEVRGLSAAAHNLLNRWDEGDMRAVAIKMGDLRRALNALRPIVDLHFQDAAHSHPHPGHPRAPLPPPPTERSSAEHKEH